MIYFSKATCNRLFKEMGIPCIKAAQAEFDPDSYLCPCCGSGHGLSYHSSYTKSLTTGVGDKLQNYELTISRYICRSCPKTHAVLPAPLIPHSRYTLSFICLVLWDYVRREKSRQTVRGIAETYGIAVSTIYAWKKRMLEQMSLYVGVTVAKGLTLEAFLRRLLRDWRGAAAQLQIFFKQYNIPFLRPIAQHLIKDKVLAPDFTT